VGGRRTEALHICPGVRPPRTPAWPRRPDIGRPDGGHSGSSGRSIRRSLVTTSSTLPQGRPCGRPPAAAVLGRQHCRKVAYRPTDTPLRSASAVAAHWPSRSSLLAALATGLLALAFLWPRTRLTPWTAYPPGPPYAEVHLGTPGPWRNVVGLTTSYTLALSAGALIAGLVLSISLIPKVRHRQR
jgi:hypothetical protein